jgi:hypothetical protein
MSKLNFAFICEEAILDKNDTLNVRNPFSSVIAPSKPAIHKGASVVVNFITKDTNKHSLEIKIKSPSKKDIIKPYKTDMGPAQTDSASLGHILTIEQLKLEEEGEYSVEISVDNRILHHIPFYFNIIKR